MSKNDVGDHYCIELQMPKTNTRDIGKEPCSYRVCSKLKNQGIFEKLGTNVESYAEKF